jgi:MraZ protein
MPKAHNSEPMLYTGQFRYGVDDSRRVMLPAKWRPADGRVRFVGILWPVAVEDYLLVLPPERWLAMLENLRKQSLSNERVAAFERVLGTTSVALEPDRFGRLCLPEDFAKKLGIEKEAEFIGRVDKFEIWTPSKFAASQLADKQAAAELANTITI